MKDRDINGLVTEDFIACWSKLSDVGKCFYKTRYKISKDDNLNKCLHHILWTEVDHHDIPPIDCFNNYCVMHTIEMFEFHDTRCDSIDNNIMKYIAILKENC